MIGIILSRRGDAVNKNFHAFFFTENLTLCTILCRIEGGCVVKCPYLAFALGIAVLLGSCRNTKAPVPQADEHPTTVGELRGVWVSYLDLDPLLTGADPITAAARLDTLLDTCKDSGMNAVFFHVRAYSDAYYSSAVFPPAESAAGLLADGFDPLAHAVDAAHERGLAIHAWINPYRIGKDKEAAVLDDEEDIFQKDGVWYYNPASPAARRAVLNGVREILGNYAVDGIHFDDYFYPAGMAAQAEAFETVPDGIAVADWRRAQVDMLVSGVCGLTRADARVFGISPSALISSVRDTAYADVAAWMAQAGYIDYICPQIYFGFENTAHPFTETLAAWKSLPRHEGVALYIGLSLYKAGAVDTYAGDGCTEWCEHDDIIARQVATIRAGGAADGFALFRFAHLTAAQKEMTNLLRIL